MTDKYNLSWVDDNIDAEWVEHDPETATELIHALIKEYYHMKDVIQIQNQKILLLAAMNS